MAPLAMTEANKVKTRFYLGYFNLTTRSVMSMNQPIVIPQQGVLENNMNQILNEDSMDLIVSIIEKIDCSRANIEAAKSRLTAHAIANTVKLNPYELSQRWSEDLKLCLQLGQLLGTPLYWHPTGAGIGQPGGIMGEMMSGPGNIQIVG